MKIKTAVIFTENNARLITGPLVDKYKHMPNCIVDPDLSIVSQIGVPPHFWKYQNGQIIAMNDQERSVRMVNIGKKGALNNIQSMPIKKPGFFDLVSLIVGALLGIALVSTILSLLRSH